jgi:hypothetical protein
MTWKSSDGEGGATIQHLRATAVRGSRSVLATVCRERSACLGIPLRSASTRRTTLHRPVTGNTGRKERTTTTGHMAIIRESRP